MYWSVLVLDQYKIPEFIDSLIDCHSQSMCVYNKMTVHSNRYRDLYSYAYAIQSYDQVQDSI